MRLTDVRKTKTIALPSFEGSEVTILSGLLVGDLDGMELTKVEVFGIESLPKLIKSWNFTDEAEAVLPINIENIKKLPVEDITFMVNQIQELITAEKKN